MKILKKKTDKNPLNTISFIFCHVYREIFADDYYPSGYFPQTGTMG